jgi:plasmid stabilization system protein ParE
MLPILWTEVADEDLAQIIEFIGGYNPIAAEKMWSRIRDCVLPLSQNPYLFRESERYFGCREVVAHPNYIVVYQVGRNSVNVLRVVHSRQKYPDI